MVFENRVKRLLREGKKTAGASLAKLAAAAVADFRAAYPEG